MKRKANARWQGDLQSGTGAVSTASGALSDTAYDFRARFEDGSGTNPEELLGAAHAGCYAMALSMILGQAGHTPERIDAEATVSLEQQDDGFAITGIHLDVSGVVPGADAEAFDKAANEAKAGCPVSKALSPDITLEARLTD
jgi:osmotically inducible protein OsmC